MTRPRRQHVSHSLRVAAAATVVVGLVSLLAVVVLNVAVTRRLTSQADARLRERLAEVLANPARMSAASSSSTLASTTNTDPDDAPVFTWLVSSTGSVISTEPGAPELPVRGAPRPGVATISTGTSTYRVHVAGVRDRYLVAAVSLADENHIENLMHLAEAVLGPIALVAVFFVALVIGIKASGPVELARVRQLEFTADASHELRTPLSVIDAEVDLALRGRRDAASYRQSLERVKHESGRLRRIVEDLLWLARVDSAPPPRAHERVDLATVVEGCLDRFGPVVSRSGLALSSNLETDGQSWLDAPADDLDRLVVVLLDNACKYTPAGGRVEVTVAHRGGRLHLVVEDSGPGIAADQRPLLFDRFHRASDEPGGTGLGLAIADSVVRSTSGRWQVGESPLGGARMEVSWHRPGRDKVNTLGLNDVVRNPA